ncbi:hypothetical protein [Rubellimicrobium thermophilum]|uniref:hypothetical protein n=1 Tax=Rubellimicrobium thermophilum TaxID=295419 RepID=UPI001182B485|nr:hypothetical protein [Rubellimicrobium thermophilum]
MRAGSGAPGASSGCARGGYLSPEGWPRALPPGTDFLETFVMTDLPAGATALAGTYVLRWEGTARIDVGGRARDIRPLGRNALRFAFAPGEGGVSIAVSGLDPADPLRAMTLVREDQEGLFAAGEIFDPDFLDRVGRFRALRFMDWMATNGSAQQHWADRPRLSDFTWAWRGVPVEVMVELANRVGADPWFTLPHGVDDDYVTRFAQLVHDRLDPRLRVHAEWSNEVWNWIFPQAAWARDRAIARWGEGPRPMPGCNMPACGPPRSPISGPRSLPMSPGALSAWWPSIPAGRGWRRRCSMPRWCRPRGARPPWPVSTPMPSPAISALPPSGPTGRRPRWRRRARVACPP